MSWTEPRDWTTGEMITASIMNTHVRDNLDYLKSQADRLEISQNEPARALSTIYQNTSGRNRIVYVSLYFAVEAASAGATIFGSSAASVQVGSSSPGDTIAAASLNLVNVDSSSGVVGALTKQETLTFVVPDNYYYRINVSSSGDGDAPTLTYWIEWEL